MYWTTRDGRKLVIEDMETTHIYNCIRMMDQQMVRAINKAMNRNDECYAEPPDSWIQTYQALVNEYNKRIKMDLESKYDKFNYPDEVKVTEKETEYGN